MNKVTSSIKPQVDSGESEKLADQQSKVKQKKLAEKRSKQAFFIILTSFFNKVQKHLNI